MPVCSWVRLANLYTPIWMTCTSHVCNIQARKESPNPNFGVRISSSGVGVFHVKGWGPKSSVCPLKPGKSNFLAGSRAFAGISWRCPNSLRKTSLCSILAPKYQSQKYTINTSDKKSGGLLGWGSRASHHNVYVRILPFISSAFQDRQPG